MDDVYGDSNAEHNIFTLMEATICVSVCGVDGIP